MADPWVTLVIGGTVLLVGFAAYLVFQRYHVPDFLVLMLLGAALGQVPIAPFGPGLLASLGAFLPFFLQLTIAFILFEGGLSLKLRQSRRAIGPLLVHVVAAFALTMLLIWLLGTRLLGLGDVASLVLAAALAGPSASMALSFAPRMHLGESAEAGIVLEAVLTNVFAVMGVLFILEWAGAPGQMGLLPYAAEAAAAAGFALLLGVGWRGVTRRLRGKDFVAIASLGVAVIVYGIAQGLLYQNGAVAVFVFGLALGYHRPATVQEDIDEFTGEFTRPAESLRSFQAEVTFALRTFFFIYLGLLLISEWGGLPSVVTGAVLVLAFVAGRAPSSLAVGRVLHLPRREQRAILASMGRGLTDVILVLLAIQSAVIPPGDASVLLALLPPAVLLSVLVCAGLLVWAARTPAPTPLTPTARPSTTPAAVSAAVADQDTK